MNVKKCLCEYCACYKAKTERCWALKEIPEEKCNFFAPVTEYYRDKKSGYILQRGETAHRIEGTHGFKVIKTKEGVNNGKK